MRPFGMMMRDIQTEHDEAIAPQTGSSATAFPFSPIESNAPQTHSTTVTSAAEAHAWHLRHQAAVW
jgi:hypothetical protein